MTLEKACKMLMIKEPFYGLFLLSLNKVLATDEQTKTMSMGFDGVSPVLYVNEKFWNGLEDKEQIAMLKHELMHLCMSHYKMKHSFGDSGIFDEASDLEINQLIQDLPNSARTIKHYQQQGINLPANAGSKEYYKVIQKQDEDKRDNPGGAGCGDHSMWDQYDEKSAAEQTLIDNQVTEMIKNTADAVEKMQGNIPGELREKLEKIRKKDEPVFDWKSYFRRVIGSSVFTYVKKSRRKESKRFEGAAGMKIKQRHTILVGIDTSGSINTRDLNDFFKEVGHLYATGAKIDIIECDTRIGRIYEYKGVPDTNITGGGGTDFKPVIDYYNENKEKYSALVFFTDGYASLKNFKARKKVIWLISSNGDHNQKYPGMKISIPPHRPEKRN